MWDEKTGSLLDLVPVGLLVIDSNGGLLNANRTGLDFLGVDERAIGRPDLGALLRDDTLRHAVSASPNGVVRIDVSEGARTYHAEVRPLPGADDGRKLLLVRDVTGLASASRFRRNFVYDLLHKVRTPLTTIVSVLRMVTSGRLDPARVDLGEILSMGACEADRLTALLGRLKDLFLVESGTLEDEVAVETVDLRPLLGRLVREVRARFAGKNLIVLEEYPEEEVPALCDPEVLGRALEAVLANACAYTPEGEQVRISAASGPDHARIVVANEGPGIPEDDLARVFERFRRGDSPAVRGVEGEGLGLYLARHLLLVQGGTILLDSTPGGTTTVEITLGVPEEDA